MTSSGPPLTPFPTPLGVGRSSLRPQPQASRFWCQPLTCLGSGFKAVIWLPGGDKGPWLTLHSSKFPRVAVSVGRYSQSLGRVFLRCPYKL